MEIENTERSKALAEHREKQKTKENVYKKDAQLCFRVLQRMPELKEGTAQVLKETFLKNYVTHASEFDLETPNAIETAMAKVLSSSGRYRITNVQDFFAKVAQNFKKELSYKKDRRNQFSLDVLFQTIDLLSVSKSEESADQNLSAKIEGDLTPQERESMLQSFRTYNILNGKILAVPTLKDAMLKKEQLVDETAAQFKDTTITAIELMFRNIIAQQLLSKKYKCDTLLAEWKKEYNFEDEMTARITAYIPPETPLLKFRSKYAQAVQTMKNPDLTKSDVFDSDLFLLRSLANYYTSWIMQVSEMI